MFNISYENDIGLITYTEFSMKCNLG